MENNNMIGSRTEKKEHREKAKEEYTEWYNEKASYGECPNCGSRELEYGDIQRVDYRQVAYPVTCQNCGKRGVETWGLIDGEVEMEIEN